MCSLRCACALDVLKIVFCREACGSPSLGCGRNVLSMSLPGSWIAQPGHTQNQPLLRGIVHQLSLVNGNPFSSDFIALGSSVLVLGNVPTVLKETAVFPKDTKCQLKLRVKLCLRGVCAAGVRLGETTGLAWSPPWTALNEPASLLNIVTWCGGYRCSDHMSSGSIMPSLPSSSTL